jgi:hypothetical protein
MPDRGMFQAIYDSPWHSPAFYWLAAAVFLLLLARELPWLTGHLVLFTFLIAGDAMATGGWSPLIITSSPWLTPVAITFVILGDLRFFALVERFARPREARMRLAAWALVAAWSLIVPLSSTAAKYAAPSLYAETRYTFLTYELMFLVLACVLRFAVLPRRLASTPAPIRRWLLGVASYEIVQYALWALADVLILSGMSWGFLLRIVPNCLYYAFFLPFVWWTAPAEAREW